MAPIRILLVDDHTIVREGYRSLIGKHPDMAVIAEAASGDEAYGAYKTHTPDVTVLDLTMPGRGGIEVIRHLRSWDPDAAILIFTMHQSAAYATQAFQAGARGYVTKSSPPELLISAIRDVHAGRKAISPDISHAMALRMIGGEAVLDRLTTREFDIFRMFAEGRTTPEIAETLRLSAKTVSNYHSIIRAKLGVSSDAELALIALRWEVVAADG